MDSQAQVLYQGLFARLTKLQGKQRELYDFKTQKKGESLDSPF